MYVKYANIMPNSKAVYFSCTLQVSAPENIYPQKLLVTGRGHQEGCHALFAAERLTAHLFLF